MIRWPSQQSRDRLDLGVELDRLEAHLTAPAGLLEAAERQGDVVEVVDVDPHRARLELARELVGNADVAGPDACGEAVFGGVAVSGDPLEIVVVERHGADDGSEDL